MKELNPDPNKKPEVKLEVKEIWPGVYETESGAQLLHDPLIGETLEIDEEGEIKSTVSDR